MNRDYWREMFSYPSLYIKMAKVKYEISPKTVSFGADRDQYFLHFVPQVKKSDKIIVWIHGGGWNSGTPKSFNFVTSALLKPVIIVYLWGIAYHRRISTLARLRMSALVLTEQ